MQDKSILDILAEKGVELQKEGSVIRAFCPFHNDTGRPNFTVYPQTNSWFCFACNMGGDVIKFLSKFDRISYAEAKDKLVGTTVNMDSLQESLDGLKIPEEELRLNNELNVFISKVIRRHLKAHPNQLDKIMTILKTFDLQLLPPVNSAKMDTIISSIKTQLGD